jgi:hypothetical protein
MSTIFPGLVDQHERHREMTDSGICGAELTDGGRCERPAEECPYHG